MGNNISRFMWKKKCGILLILLLIVTVPGCVLAAVSEDKIIFNGPFFENYGQGFSNWSGDSAPPSGTMLLKGSISAVPDKVVPGDSVEFVLNLDVSAMTITGKNDAVMKTTGERFWSLDTTKLLGERIDFPVIPDPELLGIGIGSSIPDLILRNTKRMMSVTIPETVHPGVYPVRAYVEGTDLRTNLVNITVVNGTGDSILNNTSVPDITVKPTETPTPEPTLSPEVQPELDPRFAGMSGNIVNERGLHVTSIYPYSGGAGNTMGIKIYGDQFLSPVYVTLVKDNKGIDGYNYVFTENQKYGVVMIDIPSDADLGMWDLVVTTKNGKATIPFEVTSKLIEPEISSVDAPILTPDKASDVTITGRQFMEPSEVLLAGDSLTWFSFYPKPVQMHNLIKIRVKIDAPLSDEVTSGKIDLCVINGDGATTVYEDAIAFTVETM